MREILEIIEDLDPSENDKLDHIDVLVFEYINGHSPPWEEITVVKGEATSRRKSKVPKYSRSLDELAKIRPKDWYFFVNNTKSGHWECEYNNPDKEIKGPYDSYGFESKGKTQCLAELHATIRVIEDIRSANG